jgi:hypothetical protein
MKTTPIKLLKNIFVVVLVVLLFIFVYWPMAGRQFHNLKLAEEQAKILHEKFKDDARFQGIKFMRFTGMVGVLKLAALFKRKRTSIS